MDANSAAFERQDPREQLGKHGRCRFISNSLGQRLCTYFWPTTAGNPKGVVLACHGHGSYITFEFLKLQKPGLPNVYAGSIVETFNQAGYSVCGVDYRGCGWSDGLRGYIDKFSDYVDDVNLLARSIEHCDVPGFANLPIFLMGASLGGCVAVYTAMRQAFPVRGVVLLAPMLSLEKLARQGMNRVLRPVSSAISWLFPTLQVGRTTKNEMFPEIQRAWEEDYLIYKGLTCARTAVEYLNACGYLVQHMGAITFPVLVYHSENDTMTDPDGSKLLHQQAKSDDKTLRLVNHMWHVLLKEPGSEEIQAEIIQWLDQRTPAAARLAPASPERS